MALNGTEVLYVAPEGAYPYRRPSTVRELAAYEPTTTGAIAALGGAAPGPFTPNGTQAPTTGTWAYGNLFWNSAPTPGGVIGWVCTTAGTPGTWKGWGLISE
jgi:hypothetical protein